MPRCFKFWILESQKGSIETWIRAAKFNENIPIPSEKINKLQTEIRQIGIFPLIEMDKGSIWPPPVVFPKMY